MPVFRYAGTAPSGAVKGEIEAADLEAARALLQRQKVKIASLKAKPKEIQLKIPGFGGGVGEKDLVVFTRQFSTMINAGLPIVQALDVLAQQTPNKTLAGIIKKIRSDVEGGDTLTDALRRHPKTFDNLYVNMVQAGEVGGIIDTILNRLCAYMEKAMGLKKKVKSAMVYPIAIVTIAALVVVFLMIFVIPTFSKMFAEFGQALPAPTQIVINLSNFTKKYVFYFVPALIGAVIAFKQYYRTPPGKLSVDKFMLKTPVFGPLIQKVSVARFTRTLGTLITSGVPIIDALNITARTAGNKIVELAVLSIVEKIKEGQTIAAPLSEKKVFPPMVVQMISIGESTGALDAMLGKIADFYDEEVDAAVGALTSLMEPLLMVFLGGVIGFIVVAMSLPIFKMASAIG